MPAHGKPDPAFRFRTAHEIEALDAHFDLRNVPPKSDDTLMLACWNIAHICRRFDLIAVQEVNENWHPLADLVKELGPSWDFINRIRLAIMNDWRLCLTATA